MNKFIKTPCNITVSGSNGFGKSYFIKYLITSFMRSISNFDVVIIFSNTAGFNHSYDFLSEWDEKLNYYIINPIYYEDAIRFMMKTQVVNKKNNIERQILMIFDDICGSIKDSKILKMLTTQNRHFNCTIIFAVQYINLAPPYLREVSYYDIIFELKSENSLKACYNNYFMGDFDSFGEFKKKIVNLLQKYQFLFADRLTHTKKIMICPAKF